MRWLFRNSGYKLLALVVAGLLWGVSHSTSDVERGFDVPVVIRGVPDDLVVTEQSADEINVRIAGTRAALRNLSAGDLAYPLDVSGAKPGVMTFEVDAEALDLPRGAQPVSRSPSRVDVTVVRRGTRAVEVRPDLDGEPAEGFEVAEIEVVPPRVRITGARAEVLRLSEVVTETIDVNGVREDVEREVRLSLGGRNIWLEEPTRIRVRVRVVPTPPPAEASETALSKRKLELFGTDGVRGTANVYPMTAEMALALGQALAHVFRRRGSDPRILIGKDTRLSGYMFEDALAAGICSMGVRVIQVGPLPTPALAFLTTDMRCDAGAMISASHNAYRDNGIKFFGHDGYKLPDDVERRIEDLIASGELDGLRASPDDIGRARRIDDAQGRYVVFLKKSFPRELSLEGLRMVLDCANGAGYRVGPTVFEELGAEVFTLGVDPNGRNINQECGSLHPERLVAKVRELRADVGVALDGDADRCVVVSEKGEAVDGDAVLLLCARDLAARGELKGGSVVATVMSNLGLERGLAELGVGLVRTQVGDRHVVEAMRSGGYNLGGEQSGHVIFLDHNTTGDGLLTALQVLTIMRRAERPLSELAAGMERFPQVLLNVRVAKKRPLAELPAFQESVRKVEDSLAGRGRVLIRYSGTEPKARVMVEGEDESQVRGYAEDLAAELRRALAVEDS